MKKNIGKIDKMIRISLAILIAVLYFMDIINGTVAIVLGIIAIVFVVTSFLNYCPIWGVLGIRTFKEK